MLLKNTSEMKKYKWEYLWKINRIVKSIKLFRMRKTPLLKRKEQSKDNVFRAKQRIFELWLLSNLKIEQEI